MRPVPIGRPFQKGHPKLPGAGRKAGTPNKTTLLAKNVLAAAAEEIGGLKRLVAWIKEDPKNETLFWSSMYMRLLPHQVEHVGLSEEERSYSHEDIKKKLLELGLPPMVFGCDVPQLEHKTIDLEPEKI